MHLRLPKSNNKPILRTTRSLSDKEQYTANLYAQYVEHKLLQPPEWIGDGEVANKLMNDVHVPSYCHDAARKTVNTVYSKWKTKMDMLQSELAGLLSGT